MILVYSGQMSPRLDYILSFIFREHLGIDFGVTNDQQVFINYEGGKINYSHETLNVPVSITPHGILFEDDIIEQKTNLFTNENYPAFFKTSPGYPFDIFAACFYLLSRYEEYLPHQEDRYGRFAHTASLAFKNNFLTVPLVNIWIRLFTIHLLESFPALPVKENSFSFLPTYDIDVAYSYRKDLLRTIGGFLRSPGIKRLRVLLNKEKDPFDSYDYLHELNDKIESKAIYFFLVAARLGRYDRNISPFSKTMKKLIASHAEYYEIGLHPSWKSNSNPLIIDLEKKCLESLTNKKITRSRQHYIKFSLPLTFQHLQSAGIRDDYSMGYGSINGFRASVASSYYWYDLSQERETNLRIHPFCFMDANSYYEQHQSAEETFDELMHYYSVCKEFNTQFVTVFHNNILGTEPSFNGWSEMYGKFISQIQL